MYPKKFTNWLAKRGIKGYEYISVLGVGVFIFIYFRTSSFLAAITLGIYIWIFAIFEFIRYRFNLGDINGYYRKVKTIKNYKGNYIINFFIFFIISFIILLVGIIGALAGKYIVILMLPYSIRSPGTYGAFVGIGAGLGILVVARIFFRILHIVTEK